jgi:hypothetical protein
MFKRPFRFGGKERSHFETLRDVEQIRRESIVLAQSLEVCVRDIGSFGPDVANEAVPEALEVCDRLWCG